MNDNIYLYLPLLNDHKENKNLNNLTKEKKFENQNEVL